MSRTLRRRMIGVRTDYWQYDWDNAPEKWCDWTLFPNNSERKKYRKAHYNSYRKRMNQKVHKLMRLLQKNECVCKDGKEHLEIEKYVRTCGWLTW